MAKNNLISILMCVYKNDSSEFLDYALLSLVNQKDFFYELIIVKDGLITKDLQRVIDKYKLKLKTKQISIKKNVGLPKALNIGLSKVKTKWVARFDSDDICSKDRFKTIKKVINNYGEEIDIFGTYMKEFENNLNDNNKIRYVPLSLRDIKNRLLITNPMNHISVVFKRDLIHKYSENKDEFYPLIKGFEDYALWIKLIKNGVRFMNFPLVTVYARIGDEMLRRRGGREYIFNEIRFRILNMKYFNFFENFLILICSFIRIAIFLLPINLKRIFYNLKTIFF